MIRRIVGIWPGLTGLFRYGRWSFLIIALLYAFALDALLIANLYWTNFLGPRGTYYSVGIFLFLWILLGKISSWCENRIVRVRDSDKKRNFFSDAILQYLQGNWFEAECFLNEILKRNPRDGEALLMLATLLRHTKRWAEAEQVLTRLQKLEESVKWFIEIENERIFLAESRPRPETEPSANGDSHQRKNDEVPSGEKPEIVPPREDDNDEESDSLPGTIDVECSPISLSEDFSEELKKTADSLHETFQQLLEPKNPGEVESIAGDFEESGSVDLVWENSEKEQDHHAEKGEMEPESPPEKMSFRFAS